MINKKIAGIWGIIITFIGIALLVLLRAGYVEFSYAREVILLLVLTGTGLFGGSMGEALKNKAMQSNPDEAKRIMIEQNDERNTIINSVAKSKAFDAVNVLLSTAIIALGLLGYLDKTSLITLMAVVVISQGIMLYHLSKLKSEM